ncbi:hypothetical protein OIE52_13760 [Streptomyces canus]|uniref:hypothetical protein n=1 Tax=Streptomyces canus TaxID=58343 RepID=UPI003255794D
MGTGTKDAPGLRQGAATTSARLANMGEQAKYGLSDMFVSKTGKDGAYEYTGAGAALMDKGGLLDKRLGAGRVVGAGRDRARLATLPGIGADATVALTDDAEATAAAPAETAAEVDLVVDHLWGRPAGDAIMALLRARADRSRALNWIQIGSMACPTIELPSVALRSANFRLQGNGQGAVSTRAYLAELPSLIEEIDGGGIAVTARTMPRADVGTAWTEPEVPGVRTVLTP